LSTSEISLTGESTPVKKTADAVMENTAGRNRTAESGIYEHHCFPGSGVGIVYGTGLNTSSGVSTV